MKTKMYNVDYKFILFIAFILFFNTQLLKAQKLGWAAVMGSNEQSSGKDIAMDKTGNVFSVGWYSAGQSIGAAPADFDPGPGQVLFSQSGNYLSKLNTNGTYGYVKRFANSVIGGVQISQIALDSIGNIFLVGSVYGTADLDPGTPTVMYTDSTTGNDMIVYKFSTTGIMQWYKIWPITTINYYEGCLISELEIDHNGNLILAGNLYGEIDFDLGPDTASSWGHPSFLSSFLLKLDVNGNYLWDYTIDINTNSSTMNSMSNCAINNQNEIYVVGDFWGNINFFSPDTFTLTANGFYDSYILKISETGTLQWAKSFGGGAYETASDIHFSTDGNLYLAVGYNSPIVVLANDTNSIVIQGDSINYISALIKMNESGNYEWVRQLKNANLQQSSISPVAVATDSIGQVYFLNAGLTGTNYTNYGIDSSSVYTSGEICSFVNKYNADGTFIRSSAATGNYRIRAASMAMDKNASIAFTGELISQTYIANDPNPNPIDADPDTSHFAIFSGLGTGVQGIFVIKWNQCAAGTTIADTIVCDSFSLNGNNYTQSGTFNFYETTANRCDSNAIISLTINHSQELFQNIHLCAGDSIQVGNNMYTQPGNYTNYFMAANGCDSIVNTALQIDSVDVALAILNDSIIALSNVVNQQYQWLDCNSYTAIPNATNFSFLPFVNGNYAVIINQGFCTDTSYCIAFATVDVFEHQALNSFEIYPNPSKKEVILKLPSNLEIASATVEVFTSLGQLVIEEKALLYKINVADLANGIYFIKLHSSSGTIVRRLIKLN